MNKKLFITLAVIAGSFLWSGAVTPNLEKTVNMEECNRWVDSVYNSLTPEQRVAQLIFPKFAPRRGEESKGMLNIWVKKYQVGGLLFEVGTLDQFIEMTNYAQSMAKVPLLMVFDGEWGLSMRIDGTPRFPRNMALGAVDNEELMYRYGKEMARESRLIGIPVNFAPVLDVNTNPLNPVIGDRSYGSDPARVSALGIAYSKGLEDGGMQAVAKHFPGHGDTDSDSHKTLPTVNHSLEYLDTTHLVPFRDFINAGLSGVMTAHLTMPQLDPSLAPASLSEAITTDLLRKKMGFEGLIYTDALSMKGAYVEGKNNAILAIKAGADVLESPKNAVDDINAIMKAIKKGEISWSTIEDRCKRILKYKYILGLPNEKPLIFEGLSEKINSPEAEMLNRELSEAAITVVKNRDNILPIGKLDKQTIAVVALGRRYTEDFTKMCANYTKVDVYDTISAENLDAILSHDIVICDLAETRDKELPQKVKDLDKAKKLVLVFCMDPFRIKEFGKVVDHADAIVLAYDNSPLLEEYAAQAIFGGINVTGKLPVSLEGIGERGYGITLKKSRLGFSSPLNENLNADMVTKIDSIIAQSIEQGAFPGCQLVIARHGNVVVNKSYGNLTEGGLPVTPNTVYDLASVSKTLGTLPSIMKSYDHGLFDLDDSASKYIPGLVGTGKEDITIRELLFHETGMQSGLNMYDVMGTPEHHSFNDFEMRSDIVSVTPTDELNVESSKGLYVGKVTFDSIMNRIYNLPRRKDKSLNYSCLNFCLLMDLNQRVTGIDHQIFSHDSIFAPIGAVSTGYRPLERYELSDIAPTEIDSILRKQLVHGYVHDELANFSGGVSGNAGLFSNALDLAKICQLWLNGGTYGDAQIYSPETVEVFTTTKSPTCYRGLGFDKPNKENPKNSPTCDEADASVYGHTGFTGTIFWVDPKNDLIYVFLNNRVNPSRVNRAFSRLSPRSAIFREVYRAINDNETEN